MVNKLDLKKNLWAQNLMYNLSSCQNVKICGSIVATYFGLIKIKIVSYDIGNQDFWKSVILENYFAKLSVHFEYKILILTNQLLLGLEELNKNEDRRLTKNQ